jgi:hypothetical protein
MSLIEEGKESSPLYSYTFPAMINGDTLNGASIPNYNTACSQIVGCVRVTAGGTIGQPYCVEATTGLTTYATLIFRSSSALDTSVYRIYWTNIVASSQLVTVLPC